MSQTMTLNIKNRLLTICLMTLLHFVIFLIYYKHYFIDEFIPFAILFILPTFFGTLISIFLLDKIYLIVISQLIFVTISYASKIYINNSDIHFITVFFKWLLIMNLISILIVLLIKIVSLIPKLLRSF